MLANAKKVEIIENGESFEVIVLSANDEKIFELDGFNSLNEVEHYLTHKQELHNVSTVEVFPLRDKPYEWESMNLLIGSVIA